MTSPPITGADLMDEQGLSAANRAIIDRLQKVLAISPNTAALLRAAWAQTNALLDAARSTSLAPEGFVLVPREPTPEMLAAYGNAVRVEVWARARDPFLSKTGAKAVRAARLPEPDKAIARYRAMIAAAPAPPVPTEETK